jgi:hypothetical protein
VGSGLVHDLTIPFDDVNWPHNPADLTRVRESARFTRASTRA